MITYTIFPLSEQALTVRFANEGSDEANRRVHELARRLDAAKHDGMIEAVPAFSSLTVYYDPFRFGTYEKASAIIRSEVEKLAQAAPPAKERTVVIPVCYGGEFGPDLPEVAQYHGLTEEEVIRLHSMANYKVYMIGFSPGFAYLGGLPAELATPRRAEPRLVVPAGSVGIAGQQTGVYPIETPGGWQLIGRTPLALFRPDRQPPSLLQAGDIVKFQPITEIEYRMWENDGRFRA